MHPKQVETNTAPEKTPYEMMGGETAVRRLVDRFYEIMDSLTDAKDIRQMHASDLKPMRELLFEFLSGWLGGPPLYFQKPEHRCIRSAHSSLSIGDDEISQWMLCMRKAMQECDVPADVQALIDKPLLRMCDSFRNR